MKLTKKQREVVYAMFGGRCAYCGCELPAKEWHADHKEPILRELEFARDKHGRTIMVATGKCCLERLLAESIAQRNEARKQLASWVEIYDQAVADQGVLLERAEKAEAALATARSQYRKEGLREAARACHVSMNLDAERTVLALIPKE